MWRLEGNDEESGNRSPDGSISRWIDTYYGNRFADTTFDLAVNGRWFLPDCAHYSKEGHRVIQHGIVQLLLQHQLRLPQQHEILATARNDTVRAWDSWDQYE